MEKTISTWNGFQRIDFEFEGRPSIMILPDADKKCGKWLFKTEYFDAFPNFEIDMVKLGWCVAYIKNVTRWCLDEDLDLKKRFSDFIIKEFDLYDKCVPVGMSCGGLIGTKFAARYPERVSALYLDAPVLNLLSCPADMGIGESGFFDEFTKATGVTKSQLICYREHPIDKLPDLVKNNIPVILVYGKDDVIVPFCENGAVLKKYYEDHGGTIVAIGKDNCGHHPHGLEDTTPIIDFVIKYAD